MIIAVTGLPGTGKTTFAMALAKVMHAQHLNTDKMRIELGKSGQYDEASKQFIYEKLLNTTEQCLAKDETVIIDGTFSKWNRRALLESLATHYQQEVIWIALEASETCLKERLKRKRLYSEADYKVYLEIKAQYDPLEGDFLSIRSDQHSLEEMVDLATQYLSINA